MNSVKPKLVLASASPRRLDLLAQIGVVPDQVLATDIDETPHRSELPAAYARRMAHEKAVAAGGLRLPKDAIVLAGDTVVARGRMILPKAETEDEARHCLDLLSGRRHRVLGGIALRRADGRIVSRLVTSRVTMKRLSADEIDHYIATGDWQGKAGSYAIQGPAAALIRHIDGSYSNIVGFSLYDVAAMLRGNGVLV
jgi:septum formation protein